MENIYADDWDAVEDHPGFEWNRMRLARRLGGEMLGASIYDLGPGQKSFPYHFHRANEEMLVVISGEVVVRRPDAEVAATRGDAIIFNTGPRGAHQIINRSSERARILMISTMVAPEIAEYPDSGHVGLMGDRAPGAAGGSATFLDGSATVDYFDS